MRIVSLLPSTTEIAFALGLGDRAVAVTHECDHPPAASERPVAPGSAPDQILSREPASLGLLARPTHPELFAGRGPANRRGPWPSPDRAPAAARACTTSTGVTGR